MKTLLILLKVGQPRKFLALHISLPIMFDILSSLSMMQKSLSSEFSNSGFSTACLWPGVSLQM